MSYRKLLPTEGRMLADHLGRLTRNEKSLRFMGALSDTAIESHCNGLDWCRTVVIGFFDERILRGAAEIQVADKHRPMLYEIAVTVETAWQDQGVGTEFVRRALLITRNRSARGLHITCFSDNYRIQHVAGKFGAHFHSRAGHAEADILTQPATYWSLCAEAADDGFAWANFWLAQTAAILPRSAGAALP
ncbi:MAG: GNAT family N-acetyltransferase [Steroidobacteraceae bacterium]|jgi:GNAT superfamily N-acetyltransferase